LFKDHPDWFLQKADGSLFRLGTDRGFLDYSVPEALAWLDKTLAVVLREWGMDACKVDFWSHSFECRQARLRQPGMTSLQTRRKFFEVVRRHLPPDGLLMTCVAMSMGDPFAGQWADTYRNTADIGVGRWQEQVNNCAWALPMLGLEGRKSFLLNNDSVGIMPDYPANENYFRFTWSYIHMGMLETGGRIETWPKEFVRALRKLTDRCDRGHRCRCADDRAFTGVPLPEVLYVDFPAGSRSRGLGVKQSVALFNWTDEPRVISVRRQRLGHTGVVQAVNFWTERLEKFAEEFIIKQLPAHSALLYDILENP
jgi:hypothetical protein